MLVTLRALGSVSAAAIKYHRPFSTKQEDTNQLRPGLLIFALLYNSEPHQAKVPTAAFRYSYNLDTAMPIQSIKPR